MTIDLTNQETNQIIAWCDAALRSEGLKASPVLGLAIKCQTALQTAAREEQEKINTALAAQAAQKKETETPTEPCNTK